MSPRLSIVAGLIAGIAVAALTLGGLLALAPAPVPAVASTAPPSPSAPAPTGAGPSAAASLGPTGSGPASGTNAGPSGATPPGVAASDAAPSGAALFHIGEAAPSLIIPQVGGGEIDLASLRGKPVWVNFMGTYCPPCVDEFPLMNGFAARFADDGLVVVAVDVKEDEGIVAAFAEGLGTTFPVGLDADGMAADRWDALALPVHFWVDADGVIRDGALGGIGPDIMARGLSTILPGVEVTP